MRVLFGLAALAASVNAQFVTPGTPIPAPAAGVFSAAPLLNSGPAASFTVTQLTQGGAGTTIAGFTQGPTAFSNVGGTNYQINVGSGIGVVVFYVTTNTYTAQLQYRWFPNYSPQTAYPGNNLGSASYTCDTCASGTPISCNTSTGPGNGASPANGFACASLQRLYTYSGLAPSTAAGAVTNSFSVQVFDRLAGAPNTVTYSFQVFRSSPTVAGDPQIIGMQGQDFQVHGIPDEVFNMITYPNLQVNARFVYLSSGECVDNYTACFAHPGTYISEEGIRLGSDKIHVRAGSARKGLTVSINGQKLTTQKASVKLGSVELVNHRRVVVKTPIMAISITNSDKFLNQETDLFDRKLLAIGAERHVLTDGEKFHPEVPLHGLQGQTWRNVEYPSGLDYEGSITDYQVTDGNLFGTHFVFNQFTQ